MTDNFMTQLMEPKKRRTRWQAKGLPWGAICDRTIMRLAQSGQPFTVFDVVEGCDLVERTGAGSYASHLATFSRAYIIAPIGFKDGSTVWRGTSKAKEDKVSPRDGKVWACTRCGTPIETPEVTYPNDTYGQSRCPSKLCAHDRRIFKLEDV